jgi:hypothetical protein
MDVDISNVFSCKPLTSEVENTIRYLCNTSVNDPKIIHPTQTNIFPGSQCVTVKRSDIPLIKFGKDKKSISSYVWSYKNDGLRVFLVFAQLKNNTPIVGIGVRKKESNKYMVYCLDCEPVYSNLFVGSVFDAEFAFTKGTKEPVMVVFDCIRTCGSICATLRFDQRIDIARDLIRKFIAPRKHLGIVQEPYEEKRSYSDNIFSYAFSIPTIHQKISTHRFKLTSLPFWITVKPQNDVWGLEYTHRNSSWKNSEFEYDGGYSIVLTDISAPYTPLKKNHTQIFKFKPGGSTDDNSNTLDFMVTMSIDSNELPLIPTYFTNKNVEKYRSSVGNVDLWFLDHNKCYYLFTRATISEIPNYSVVEFAWNTVKKTWTLQRMRDKTPNAGFVVFRTIDDIEDGLKITDFFY